MALLPFKPHVTPTKILVFRFSGPDLDVVMRSSLIGLVVICDILGGFLSNDVSAFQTSLPETDVPIKMDIFLKELR